MCVVPHTRLILVVYNSSSGRFSPRSVSRYAIDDRTSSWTEVGDRLRGYGIDLDHNRWGLVGDGRSG